MTVVVVKKNHKHRNRSRARWWWLHKIGGGCWCILRECAQVVLVLILGVMAGLFLAMIHQQTTFSSLVDVLPWNRIDPTSLSSSLPSSSTTNLTALLVQEEVVAQKPESETNTYNCTLPLGAIKVTVRNNDPHSLPFQLVVHKEQDFISDHIMKKGYWEIETVHDMAKLAPSQRRLPPRPLRANKGASSTVFYDVGAHVGYYSFLFAAAGYEVVAIEAEATNVALFRASLCWNAPSISHRIRLIETALSNNDVDPVSAAADSRKHHTTTTKNCRLIGRVNARTRKYLYASSRLVCDTNYKCHSKKDLICQANVPVTSLDQLLLKDHSNLPIPDILKVNVGMGQEYSVLQGGRQLLTSAHKKPALIQYENKDGRVEVDIAAFLTSAGYTVGTTRGHDGNTVAEDTTAAAFTTTTTAE